MKWWWCSELSTCSGVSISYCLCLHLWQLSYSQLFLGRTGFWQNLVPKTVSSQALVLKNICKCSITKGKQKNQFTLRSPFDFLGSKTALDWKRIWLPVKKKKKEHYWVSELCLYLSLRMKYLLLWICYKLLSAIYTVRSSTRNKKSMCIYYLTIHHIMILSWHLYPSNYWSYHICNWS